jgi:hypothetical protein
MKSKIILFIGRIMNIKDFCWNKLICEASTGERLDPHGLVVRNHLLVVHQ